jgi:hypothetical protein
MSKNKHKELLTFIIEMEEGELNNKILMDF